MKKNVREWFEEGVRCFQAADGMGAVKAFKMVIKLDPAYRHADGDNPFFYMGKIHEVEGDLADAITMYSRALCLDPYDEESLIGRGSCFNVKKKYLEAITDFKKVIEIPSAFRRAPLHHLYYAIAETYRKKGDYRNALTYGQKALIEDPENFRCQELVAEMVSKLKQTK
jgi:tetratricopeptide (TPR) repeat protein